MIRGLYASATGMLALMGKQDVIANNLANASTNGFKKDYVTITSFPEELILASERRLHTKYSQRPVGQLSLGAQIGKTGFIGGNGSLKQTGDKLNLAIVGEGFFAVRTPAGEMYTRNGGFDKDALGKLVDQDGHLVLGEKGPITIRGDDVHIDESGKVYVDGAYVDTLKVRTFSNGELEKAGRNLFAARSAGIPAERVIIRQGFLEGSNVDVASEMVEMVATVKSFEVNQRVLKVQDEVLGRAVNDVGRFA